MRIEDGLLCIEIVINTHLGFHMSLWIVSMDMREAFDRFDHRTLMEALRPRNLSEEYIALLSFV